MSAQLFKSVKEGHDPKNRVVFVCQDPKGFYVYKPATGFKSTHFKTADSAEEHFNQQCAFSQNNAFYSKENLPKKNENYPNPVEENLPEGGEENLPPADETPAVDTVENQN